MMDQDYDETPDTIDEQFLAYFHRVAAASREKLEKITVPLMQFNANGDNLFQRTGVLLDIVDRTYLLTAAHELHDLFESGGSLVISMYDVNANPISLHGETFWFTPDPQKDIAISRLNELTARAIAEHYASLRLSEVMSQNDVRHTNANYWVLGYPWDLRVRRDDLGGRDGIMHWGYLTAHYQGDYSNVENYDQLYHLILDYKRSAKTQFGDEQYAGMRAHPPGLSGCGIWFVGNSHTHPNFRPDDFVLAAIQTSWHKDHEYAKGTWIDQALWLIWQKYSDTRNPMRLNGIEFFGDID